MAWANPDAACTDPLGAQIREAEYGKPNQPTATDDSVDGNSLSSLFEGEELDAFFLEGER
jgi:hypothetical protein